MGKEEWVQYEGWKQTGSANAWTLFSPEGDRVGYVEATRAGYVPYVFHTSGNNHMSHAGMYAALDACRWVEEHPDVRDLVTEWRAASSPAEVSEEEVLVAAQDEVSKAFGRAVEACYVAGDYASLALALTDWLGARR